MRRLATAESITPHAYIIHIILQAAEVAARALHVHVPAIWKRNRRVLIPQLVQGMHRRRRDREVSSLRVRGVWRAH